jgi:cytochrome P450
MQNESPLYYEPFDPSCRAGLFDTYARLHREAPVRQCESGVWTVVRLDDVRILYTRTEAFSNRPNGAETVRPTVDMSDSSIAEKLAPIFEAMLLDTKELLSSSVIVGADPPIHTRIRGSVNRAFTRGRIEALRGYIEEEVARCLEGLDHAPTFDVYADLAIQIPLRVMTRLFGLPASDDEKFQRWALMLATQLNAHETRGTATWLATHYSLISEFADYFVPLMTERAKNPGADLLSDIMAAEKDALTASEGVLFVLTLLGAGIETTANLIGNVTVELLRNPDQLDLLLADPALVDAAIEESLRYDSPFQFVFRETTSDIELSGVTIPGGSIVLNMIGAANHDPAHFNDPDRFDITRKPAHVGFGQGIHFCLGAALARMEARAALRGILPHLREFALDEEHIVDRPSLLIWGRLQIPLVRRSMATSGGTAQVGLQSEG